MENHKSRWLIEGNELDIGRGVEALLLGALMLVVRILRTFWAFVAGRNDFKELIFAEEKAETLAVKFARPLTYFSVIWVLYGASLSVEFTYSELLAEMAERSAVLLPKTLWTLFVKYMEALAALCHFVADNLVSGDVWKLIVGLAPILGLASSITVSSILACKILQTRVVPREHLSINCYALGTTLVVDFAYGVAEICIDGIGIPHILLTAVFVLAFFPLVFYRWIVLMRRSANTDYKRFCAILFVSACILIALSIVFVLVFYSMV